jgi:hypothetical protein
MIIHHTVIPKLNGTITLDGIVDESAWFEIEPLPLVTHWPSFGDIVDLNKTQIRIAHDEEYLYVSCICYENPDKISSPTYKRDEVSMAMDGLAIMLDTFNDNETGLWFNVSASGSRVMQLSAMMPWTGIPSIFSGIPYGKRRR